jgi:hypothetical protein
MRLTLLRALLALSVVLLTGTQTIHAATGSAIGRAPLDTLSFNVSGGGEAVRVRVPATHPGFDEAFRIDVTRRSARAHEIALGRANTLNLAAGDVVAARFSLRSVGDTRARVAFYAQDSTANYRALATLVAEAGPEWTEHQLVFTVDREFFKNELIFNFFFGDTPQSVEFGGLRITALGASPAPEAIAAATAAAVIREDFEKSFVPLASATTTTQDSAITGALPPDWSEDSAWANVQVAYSALAESPFAGRQSLTIDTTRIVSGRVQLIRPLTVSPSHFIRLSVAMRSPGHQTVRLQLRQRSIPYRAFAEATFTALPEWGRYEALFPPVPADAPKDTALFVGLDSTGHLELDDLTLTYLSPSQALGNKDLTGNLLSTSSWPLGVAAPWAIGGDERPPEALQPDPAVVGPTGLPALRVAPYPWHGNKVIAQLSSPFVGRPGARHTFSVWARSEQPGQTLNLRFGPPSAELYKAPFSRAVTLTREWKRHSITLDLPFCPEGFYLARINTHAEGVFWLDGAQVELGAAPSSHVRTAPVELALQPVADYGLHLAGEAFTLRLAAWGDLASATSLRGELHDVTGRAFPLPPVNLPPARDVLSVLDLTLPPVSEAPLGSYSVVYTALGADGKPVSRPAEALLHRVAPPIAAGRLAPDSAFGTHIHWKAREAAMVKKLGFNWVRGNYRLSWSDLEPRPGQWTFERADQAVEAVHSARLNILEPLGGVPRWASVASDDWQGGNPGWWRTTAAPRPEHLDGWQEYARRVMERYRDRIDAWEVWNEPFLPSFFVADVVDKRPVRAEATLLVELGRRAAAARVAAGITATPLLWNTGSHYGDSEAAFDRAAAAAGLLDHVDGVSVHKYTSAPLGFPGDEFARVGTAVRELAGSSPAFARLWNTEGGRGPSESINFYRTIPPFDQWGRTGNQADHVVRYYVSNLAQGITKVFSYAFYPDDSYTASYSYTNVGGALSPAGPALSHLAQQLESRHFREIVALPSGVNAYLFTSSASAPEAVAVLLSSGAGRLPLPATPEGLTATDLFGNSPTWPARLGGTAFYLRGPGLDAARLRALFPTQ